MGLGLLVTISLAQGAPTMACRDEEAPPPLDAEIRAARIALQDLEKGLQGLQEIQKEVQTMEGKRPQSDHAVRNAVARVDTAGARGIATTKYENCGRRYGEDGGKYLLTPKLENEVVQFVKMWRNKKFCAC